METLQEFSSRMSEIEKEEEFQVGPYHRGRSRAVFFFEKQACYLESSGYVDFKKLDIPVMAKAVRMVFHPPSDHWWTDYMSYGKTRAKKIAKHYKASVVEAPYAEEDGKWLCYRFEEFEDLMKFVYDRFTGEFENLWGREPKPYVQCYGDQTPVEINPNTDFE